MLMGSLKGSGGSERGKIESLTEKRELRGEKWRNKKSSALSSGKTHRSNMEVMGSGCEAKKEEGPKDVSMQEFPKRKKTIGTLRRKGEKNKPRGRVRKEKRCSSVLHVKFRRSGKKPFRTAETLISYKKKNLRKLRKKEEEKGER